MRKLEQLISELCPNGVCYKTIKEMVGVNRGSRLTKSQLSDAFEYEVYHGSKDTPLGYYSGYNAPQNTTIVVNTGGIGGVKFLDKPFWCSDGSFWLGHNERINDKYLYYALSGYEDYFYSRKRVGGVPTIDRSVVETFRIPIPPLEVQAEIVRILDNFTELTAELSAELSARETQYNYYRDSILSFHDSFPMVELGSVAKVTKLAGYEFTKYVKYSDVGNVVALRGLNVKSGRLVLDDVKYIDQSDFSKLTRSKLKRNDMLFTYVGTVGEVALIDEEEKYYLAPNVAMVRVEDQRLIPRFLMHYFQSFAFREKQINRLLQSSSMKNIPMEKIRRFMVPIPPIEVQKNIVKQLDTFDSITGDVRIGLPAEIESRQKQYEYYRDKLFTFPELKQ